MVRSRLVLALLAIILGVVPIAAQAVPLTLSASGTGTGGQTISATAVFDIVTHDFGSGAVDAIQITLTNTSATTSYRGNLITGIFVDFAGTYDPTLPTNNTGFDGFAPTIRHSNSSTSYSKDVAPAVNNTATDGTWILANGPFGSSKIGVDYSAYDFAITTVGNSTVGTGNGNNVDGDNYGIAAAGSDLTQDGLPQATPVIDTTVTLWILKPADFNLSLIQGVSFGYGSLPDNNLTVEVPSVPEPGTLALVGSGLLGIAGAARRRRKARRDVA